MSLLARVKISGRRFLSHHPIAAFQQLDFYSTRVGQKTQRSTSPRIQRSSEPSTSLSRSSEKQADSLTVWPKPIEIPYQTKVANFVNLIGHVVAPVRFEVASDGKNIAATVISQETSGEKNSLLIPVFFEGDLAHIVSYHVKENDCVFVSGKFRVEPMKYALNDSLVKFYIVGESINFVQGLERNFSGKKLGVLFSVVEVHKPVIRKIEQVIERVDNDEDFKQQWEDALGHAKVKGFSREKVWSASSSVILRSDSDPSEASLVEKGHEKKSGDCGDKKKDGDLPFESWRDLVKNPLEWWDYRDHKSKGLVKEKFPDFKHKGTGKALWVDSAPKWVLPGLKKLEFDVMVIEANSVQGAEVSGRRKIVGKGEDSWKSLVENPNKWWDNRLDKKNPKAPDFKHKETGEGLWISDSPDWVVSRLPPLKDGQNTAQKYIQKH